MTLNSESPFQSTKPRDHAAKHANSSAGTLATTAGVSRHKAEQAIKVVKHAAPAVIAQVEAGTISLREAVKTVPANHRIVTQRRKSKARGLELLGALLKRRETFRSLHEQIAVLLNSVPRKADAS